MKDRKTREAVWQKFGRRCAYCGRKIAYNDMQVDHLIPKRAQGTDDFDNLMPSCRMCNHYKRGNKLETFRQMIFDIPKKLARDSYIYKIGVAYGNIMPNERGVMFWFEKYPILLAEIKAECSME